VAVRPSRAAALPLRIAVRSAAGRAAAVARSTALVPLEERDTRRVRSADLEQVLVNSIATNCDVMNQASIANERRIDKEQAP
jgi:hypothetical protein